MPILTREQILQAQDYTVEEVEVPEWGGAVLVRSLTGRERDQFEGESVQQRGKNIRFNWTNVRARLVALSVVDEEGKRLFSDSDVKALGEKSAGALQRVFEVTQRLSGLSDEDLEELTEGFDDAQSDGSTSG